MLSALSSFGWLRCLLVVGVKACVCQLCCCDVGPCSLCVACLSGSIRRVAICCRAPFVRHQSQMHIVFKTIAVMSMQILPPPLLLSLRKTGVKSLPHTNAWAALAALFVITLTLFWLRLNTHTDTIINILLLNHNTHLTAITHITPFQFPGRLNRF